MNAAKAWKLVVIVLVICLAGVFWKIGWLDRIWDKPVSESTVWSERAEEAELQLSESFWDEKHRLYNNASPCLLQTCDHPFNYWWLAHAVELQADAYGRTGDEGYKERLSQLYQGILDRNVGFFPNDYYDDMAWMGLAWLKAYDVTEDNRYKEAVLILWKDIETGWNDSQGGGIAWRKEQQDYKNTPANAPSSILAAKLYERFKDQQYLDWATKIYDWQKKSLVDPDSGLVWDGVNRTGDGHIDKEWQFSYNQGTFIGAGVELFRATGQERYLDDAKKTATFVVRQFANGTTGMLPSEGDGDGALFKGILIRYLGELIQVDKQPEPWVKLIRANAESLWTYGKEKDKAFFGSSWGQTPESPVQLSAYLSGVMLLETMARLERDGKLDE
ncbi:glycoside hydrolase family 76 protein [Cohnella silvisoli]|uniref:Glycoside hydrolase family 76 protein n=1 Tax=Cohnella silvisoli TaxID=2873699 RepID=A0ABV1KNN2_9BACL|nr:glycoside hydrolase family 76 protein [Cohnella silvisoli]MCD9020452.1 glycosyl hydrolase [Cohnella silvisoli]